MASSIDLHPPIHWGQSTTNVSLRIGLTDVKYPRIDIDESSVKFQATGCSGSRGEQLYSFEIELFDKIDAKASTYKINDREIDVNLKKIKTKREANASNAWPRLTKNSAKLPWLKTDFDKMAFSEDESDDELKKQASNFGFNDDIYKSLGKNLRKNEKSNDHIDIRTNWLLFYNLFQFMAYLWVFIQLIFYFINHKHLRNGYRKVQNPIKMCQAVAIMETIHPLIGFTKGDWSTPLMQFLARNFILFIVVNLNPHIQSSPIVPYLLLVWSFVELFRYPYYGMRLLSKQNRPLTWLRYTLWIVLYPLGTVLEALVVYESIDYYSSTRSLSIRLPNQLNFGFSFPLFLQCYLVLMPLGLAYLMQHMWIQRRKTLTTKTKKTN